MSATATFQLLNGHPGTKLEEPWFALLALSWRSFYLQTLKRQLFLIRVLVGVVVLLGCY